MFKMVPYLYKLFSYDINFFLTPDSVRHFQAGSSFIVKSVTFVAAVCNLLHIRIDSVVLNYYIT